MTSSGHSEFSLGCYSASHHTQAVAGGNTSGIGGESAIRTYWVGSQTYLVSWAHLRSSTWPRLGLLLINQKISNRSLLASFFGLDPQSVPVNIRNNRFSSHQSWVAPEDRCGSLWGLNMEIYIFLKSSHLRNEGLISDLKWLLFVGWQFFQQV
jgi:hypothetical protein